VNTLLSQLIVLAAVGKLLVQNIQSE